MKDNAMKEKFFNDFKASHNGIANPYFLPDVVEKTKVGNRKKSWKFVQNNEFVSPLFTLDEYMKVDDLTTVGNLVF